MYYLSMMFLFILSNDIRITSILDMHVSISVYYLSMPNLAIQPTQKTRRI